MKIAIAGWSLHRRFQAGSLKLIDFPEQARKEFGVKGIELNSPFFESLEDEYLRKLKEKVAKNKMKIVNIAVDSEGDLASTNEEIRKKAVKNHQKWIYIAKKVGSPSFRANTGGPENITREAIEKCIKSFTELCQEAEKEGITVLIENHGGISKDPDIIVRIMEEVKRGIGTCPDFGNFPDETRYQDLEKIAKYAKCAHAKFYEFDEKGEDTKINASRCINILKKAGFDGWLSIEFEGKENEKEGIKKSIILCQKYIGEVYD
ncbi:sugar phosphate isomerase/epimerase [Candidatus Aerophobetes bacterium]|nr:sugar phosphate isomerase/epimerase [Candidatus Aerophobetes bacterium]